MTAKGVPSKIVIAGNSKMSLNDRFSTIPKPRTRAVTMKASKKIAAPLRDVYSAGDASYDEYVPKTVIRRPRRAFPQRAVPIQNRVSFVKAVPVQHFYPRNFVQKNSQFQNNFRKPFRPNTNNQNRRVFHNNNRFNNNNSGFNGNRNNFQGRKTFPTMPKKKSVAELDRELDDYMRKSKHTPITI